MFKEEMQKLGLHFVILDWGEVDVMEDLTEEQLQLLSDGLKDSGLELVDNKKAILIEKIKNIITQVIHQSDEPLKINFSDYLSEKLNYELQYSSMLLRDAQHNLPNQRAFELAIQNMQPTDGWPITVWIIRLNRMTQLQTAMSADSVSVAFRDGVKRFADWLDRSFAKFERGYQRLLHSAMEMRTAIIGFGLLRLLQRRKGNAKQGCLGPQRSAQ